MAVLLVPAEGDSPDAIAAALVAFGVGAAGAVALDAAVLAFTERPATATVAWRPAIVVQPSRWTVGAVGVFQTYRARTRNTPPPPQHPIATATATATAIA